MTQANGLPFIARIYPCIFYNRERYNHGRLFVPFKNKRDLFALDGLLFRDGLCKNPFQPQVDL
jgi:hypothetical protein